MACLGVGVEPIIPKSSKRFVHVESALAFLRGDRVTGVYAGTATILTNLGDVLCSLCARSKILGEFPYISVANNCLLARVRFSMFCQVAI